MSEKLSINEWAEEDRPREKMERLGAENLSNAELLAILIGSGSSKESAVDLMKRVMNDCNNNLNTLGKLSLNDLEKYNGLGPAKSITILAACELGKRRQREEVEKKTSLNCASDIYEYMHPKMQDLDVEEAWIILMNQKAILSNATVLALIHNHPSNNPNPSRQDDRLTERVMKACDIMRIYFLDHVIVTDGVYYSYREAHHII